MTACLDAVRDDMRRRYRDKQEAILARLAHLETLLDDPSRWWNQSDEYAEALAHFRAFAANIQRNFGPASPCYARIDAPGNWADWRGRQVAAITGIHAQRHTWDQALDRLRQTGGT